MGEVSDHPLVSAYRSSAKYSLQNENGNRSSRRTEILHNKCVEFLLSSTVLNEEEWKVDHEVKVTCSRATEKCPDKKFTIDVVFTHKDTDRRLYLLIKSVERSYNKNKENFANTTVGEVERLFGYSYFHGNALRQRRKHDIAVFMTLVPDKLLNGSKVEKAKYTFPHSKTLRMLHSNTHQVTAILETGQFENFESFVENLSGKLLNEDEVCSKIEKIGENIYESIRL